MLDNCFVLISYNMRRHTTKPRKWYVRPAKTQISLGIRPVWSESSLSACRKKLESLATQWAHSKDSNQTGWSLCWMLIHFVGFVVRKLYSLCRLYFISFGIIEPILVILKIKSALGGVWSLANYSVTYEETQSNRVSDFRDVSKDSPFLLLFYYVMFYVTLDKRMSR